ncbi:RNA pseudouridine synthase 6, chloroplastic isoform X2 [Ricinus communis]|uniref:RNA pseudouridine synthase 6, chloroplastic isoform X2 n=1 Tax=Ricinus communis TaxID=3988 RepID=UPI000772B323|nr:RNA pseudouridine synthase 6, chloroplastic isoform X2 [Ricinus communis]|eukprot:XP_015574301.1 RNA pseudouridine synthase 6, chloroplastic isoform X1 [Ricinus communis]
MSSLTLASIFTCVCQSYGAPVSRLRTLTPTHSYFLNKHHADSAWFYSSSHKRTFCSQYSKPEVVFTTVTSCVNGYSGYDRLLPCPSQNRPPRVEHLVVLEEGPVLDYICKALDLPPLFVADLIHFGAVHYALVCPQPPPTATPEQIRLFEEFTAPSVLKKRASIKGKTVREAQKTFRVSSVHQFLEVGTYLRVYVHPRRFPRCYEIDWKSRIIAVTESYVVLDKPAGTSVGGTTNNIEETCATFATRALGLTIPLKTTHQIDNCTEGCVVLARTNEYCPVFHGKIRENKVKKLYLALAACPVPVGVITHYMRPGNIPPRLVSEEFIEGWYLCQLEVLECRKVPWPDTVTEEKYSVEDCGWPSKDFAYECKINLLTGRTHQIRAQLAACGAPLVGDSMYMPAAIAEMANPGVNPFGKHKKQYTGENDESMGVAEWVERHGKEPSIAIGLQACEISWGDSKHIYKAGPPWWR